MAAPISGRNGRLYVDTSAAANGSAQPIVNLSSFSVNQTADRTEVTSFGDTTKAYVAGLKDAQGDFSGFWDADGDDARDLAMISQDRLVIYLGRDEESP